MKTRTEVGGQAAAGPSPTAAAAVAYEYIPSPWWRCPLPSPSCSAMHGPPRTVGAKAPLVRATETLDGSTGALRKGVVLQRRHWQLRVSVTFSLAEFSPRTTRLLIGVRPCRLPCEVTLTAPVLRIKSHTTAPAANDVPRHRVAPILTDLVSYRAHRGCRLTVPADSSHGWVGSANRWISKRPIPEGLIRNRGVDRPCYGTR